MASVGSEHDINKVLQAAAGRETAEAVIEWYWAHGAMRKEAYAISPVWVRGLYQRCDLLRSIEHGRAQIKASLGLWGPSQSGKSTLISQFVDQGANDRGDGGCLDWGTPVLFSSRDTVPEGVVVFNPHNIGSDASGCVSRFVLRSESEVSNRDFPVEIQLLNSSQLMHAISAGYLSECQREENWTIDRLEELLTKWGENPTSAHMDRRAFEHLHEVVDVIDLLIEARDERFTGLNARDQWPTLANRIIESGALLSDQRKVQEFAATLLWGGRPSLTRLYERLLAAHTRLPKGARLFCTMEVAATLVNIESYRIFLSDASEDSLQPGARRINAVIRQLSWEKRGDDALIGTCFPGRKLLETDRDFGLLQGLVRELVIPLRVQASQEGELGASTFVRLMKNAELVDFPGVPWRDKDAKEKLLDLESLPDADDSRLLTEVLKRGKVASLVNGYSRTLGIDSFMLLARAGSFVPKVEQIHRGLVAWWRFVDPTYDVYKPDGREPPLPLFFNMTFFANIINKFAQGAITTGYQPLTEMVKQLEPFVDPTVCTMLTTTYPQFLPEGQIVASPDRTLAAVDSILKDQSFGSRCKNVVTKESLSQMTTKPDGGVSYLFEVLAGAISTVKRQRLLEQRYRDALIDIQGFVADQSPIEGNDQCRKDVEALKVAVQTALIEKKHDSDIRDPAAWVSYRLRLLLDVNAECLDPVPSAGQIPQKYEDYVRHQIKKWIESKSSFTGLSDLGLRDPAMRTRLLGFLSERVDVRAVAKWVRTEIPARRSSEDSWELRRIVAVSLSKQLTRTANGAAKHPALDGKDGVIASIQKWAEAEDNNESDSDVQKSPHFSSVIAPVTNLFDQLANGAQAARPRQIGDDEALALLGRVRSLP